ncbi:MAG: penicillin-binding protein 1C [Candidatus Gracilibacteria bacterium]|jgi:penicillin-binding protein 1C
MKTFFHRKDHPIIFWLLAAVFGLLFLSFSFYLYVAYVMPLPDLFVAGNQLPSTKILDRNGVLLYEILQPDSGKKTFVPLNQIPKNFINATLAAEDINFYEHGGVDLGAILRSLFFNVREQRIVSGASTIPQQLVRNLLGVNRERGLSDKIMEALYAVRLSHSYTKDQVLELYLNKIYYGNLAYGSDSAALDYFDKHVNDLDLAQSAFLAGLPQAPSAYNPFLYFDPAKKRQQYVLDQMTKNGFISDAENKAAYEEPLHLRRNKTEMKAPHFVQYVINELGDQIMNRGGLSIYTTLDYNLQLKAENTVSRQVELLHDKHVTNGALLSLDPKTGQILAWVGSENYFNENIDGAVDMVTALRQPGSAVKPFNYLLALEKGYTPATILDDVPTTFSTDTGAYEPKNYDLRYHGPVRLRNALASSFNIPAVKTLDFVGVEAFISFLRKIGINTLDQDPNFYGLALTLGGAEVRMLDFARAFNMLANYGNERDLSTILKIEDSQRKILYQWTPPPEQFVLGQHGKEHAYQIIDILKDPLARLGGFGEGSVLELSRPAAVKTGTTRNFRDNWTVGFTPQLLTAVWVGNADATPMNNISGVDGAGPIWHDFMESALGALGGGGSGMAVTDFVKPAGLKQVEICGISGKLPTDLCQDRVFELFVPGTEPKEKDDYYKQFWVDKNSGHIIQDACVGGSADGGALGGGPQGESALSSQGVPANLQQKTFVVYPPKFQKWAVGESLALPYVEPCGKTVSAQTGASGAGSTGGAGAAGSAGANFTEVIIDSPRNGDEYMIEGTLPLKDQKIPLRVTVPLDTGEVRYFIDETLVVANKVSPFSALWLPIKGSHKLRAEVVLSDGKVLKSKNVAFEVR